MSSIDYYAELTEQKLGKMDQYIADDGKKMNDEAVLELKKLRFRIKDF